MAIQFVFVVSCSSCRQLIKVANDTGGGLDHYFADDDETDLLCPECGHTESYQMSQLRRVRESALD